MRAGGAGTSPTRAATAPRGAFAPRDIPLSLLLIALSARCTLPFLWLLLTSLRPPEQVLDPGFFPRELRPQNYLDVFRLLHLHVAAVSRKTWSRRRDSMARPTSGFTGGSCCRC